MSAPNTTPGPWQIGMMGGEKQTHVVDMGKPPTAPFVALYDGSASRPAFAVVHSDGDRCEIEANARLIAAAPELYAELQQFVNGVETRMIDSPADETLANITRRAKAALAKARGDQ